jgi:hypothetical protein
MVRYSSIMLYFDMSEKGGIAQIRFSARTDVITIVGLVTSSATASTLLERMFETGGEH